MLDLYEEMASITNALSDHGIRHALVGGLAYSFYVELRATEDIDFFAAEEDWETICSLLLPFGFQSLVGPMDFETIRIRRLTKIQDGDVLVVGFLLADELSLEGLTNPVVFPFHNRGIPLAPVHVLIGLKKRRMSRKDRADIEGLEELLNEKPT